VKIVLPTLETERLRLRKISLADADHIFAYACHEKVTEYVTWETHRSLADTKLFIAYIFEKYEKQTVAPWGIVCKETDKLLGTIDFVWWDSNQQKAEVGYALAYDYWGKNIMTEALKAVINFGFSKMDLVRIQGKCLGANKGFARVMEKAGLTYEGTKRKSFFLKGTHHDIKMYSIIDNEWQAQG